MCNNNILRNELTRIKSNSIINVLLEGGINLYMKKDEKASISVLKVICVTLVIIVCLGIGVVKASNVSANNIKIVFPNNYELNIITTKTKVEDILKENHIVLLGNEISSPKLDEEIAEDNVILITKIEKQSEVFEIEKTEPLNINNIKESYSTIVEKIVQLEVEIPFETVTKDVSGTGTEEKATKILQEGENGIKVITYKITYMDNIEVNKLELETKIIKEPIDKIIQVSAVPVSRSGVDRTSSVSANPASVSNISLAKKVENISPKVITLNATAYTASSCGKTETDKDYEITSSGAIAKSWYTVAAGKCYPIGTVMYIPYFKDKPNGGWFVVQDRGSAIKNGNVDVYMDTISECKQFGRRNLECYIYEF